MRAQPLRAFALACLTATGLTPISATTIEQISKGVPGEEKSAAGLKEALRVGVGNAVNLTGQVDGYFRNEAIKILMPKQLQSLEKGLRAVGYGPQVDEFVLSMNRAAERAAPQARGIFVDAIGQMTFSDARQILTGGETAATDYFKAKTSDKLTAAFRPVVEKAMNETGVTPVQSAGLPLRGDSLRQEPVVRHRSVRRVPGPGWAFLRPGRGGAKDSKGPGRARHQPVEGRFRKVVRAPGAAETFAPSSQSEPRGRRGTVEEPVPAWVTSPLGPSFVV